MGKPEDIPGTQVDDPEELRRPLTDPDQESIPLEDNPDREPNHPGETLVEYLDHYNLSQGKAASILDVSRDTINKIVNGHRTTITPDMALRLSRLFEETNPEFWLNLSRRRKLWEERENRRDEYEAIEERKKAV